MYGMHCIEVQEEEVEKWKGNEYECFPLAIPTRALINARLMNSIYYVNYIHLLCKHFKCWGDDCQRGEVMFVGEDNFN